MKKTFAFLFLFWQVSFLLWAQTTKEFNNWYFGQNAGLNFNSGAPVPLTNGQLVTEEGCSSISDANGNLLFYTDGSSVYNKQHALMANGAGLMGASSSTQSAIIVPQPNSTRFYIFTVDMHGGPNGLRYSVVDMNRQNGLGEVITSNTLLITPSAEKVIATKKANITDYWVVSHKFNSFDFVVYSLTSSGLNPVPTIYQLGAYIGGVGQNAQGYLKISPDGRKLVSASDNMNFFEIFDFNAATGAISNPMLINHFRPYGVEFSPDSKLLYISGWSSPCSITQYDLQQPTATAISASAFPIHQGGANYYTSALQLGPDNKIYVASGSSTNLHVINNPNAKGIGCNFQQNTVWLGGRRARLGLPNVIHTRTAPPGFTFTNTCSGSTTTFQVPTTSQDSVRWNFNDPTSGASNSSTLLNPGHQFTGPGSYLVTVTVYEKGVATTFSQQVNIVQYAMNLGPDVVLCPGTSLVLDSKYPAAIVKWQDNSASATYAVISPGKYWATATTECGPVSDTILIKAFEPPVIDLGIDTSLCEGATLILDATLPGATYVWKDGSTNPTFKVTSPGIYSVRVTVKCGTFGDQIRITDECPAELIMPNIFTPNADQKNDTFKPLLAKGIKTMQTNIYNRWGNLIFETDDPRVNWEGGPGKTGVYFWQSIYSDNQGKVYTKKGWVEVVK